jgi:ATP phosphoribosyltransferase
MVSANGVNGVNGAGREEEFVQRQRQGSRSLPFLTDVLGYSLNDRLLFAVPKSTFLAQRNHT